MGRLLLVLIVLFLSPTATSQAEPRDECVRRCRPYDADVRLDNAGPQDPVSVFLYPSSLAKGTLTTAENLNVEQEVPPVRRTSGELCQQVEWSLGQLVPRSSLGPLARTDAWMPAPEFEVATKGAELVLYLRPSNAAVPAAIGVDTRIWTGRGSTSDGANLVAFGSIDVWPDLVTKTWEVRVPLKVQQTRWFEAMEPPRRLFVETTVCSTSTSHAGASPFEFSFINGPKLPARLILDLIEPVRVKTFEAAFRNETLVVRGEFLDVLGSYDLAHVGLEVFSWHDRTLSVRPEPYLVDHSLDHAHPNRPVRAEWRVPIAELPVARSFWVHVGAGNLQGSYVAVVHTEHEVVRFQGTATPSVEPVFWLLGLLLLMRLRR